MDVSNLNVVEKGINLLKDVALQVRSGEILGIAGIEGNGQTQLIEALTGLIQPQSMNLKLNGKTISGNAMDFINNRIAHVPEDRLTLGLVKEMSILDNIILGYHRKSDLCSKRGIRKLKYVRKYGEELKTRFLVKAPNADTLVSSLSGGNQQKIVIARVFNRDPIALIIAHPTRGVDIGAIEYIHQQMIALRDQGKAILLISADLDEVKALSDRILVLYEGQIVAESYPGELSDIELGLLMTGTANNKSKEEQLSEKSASK